MSLSSLKGLIAKRDKINKELQKESETILKKEFIEFFKEHKGVIKRIQWEQYTPYFNDGDTCEFNFNGLEVVFQDQDLNDKLNVEEGYGYEVGSRKWHLGADSSKSEEVKKMLRKKDVTSAFKVLTELNSVLHKMEDQLKETFGDHVHIKVTPESIDIEEYQHD